VSRRFRWQSWYSADTRRFARAEPARRDTSLLAALSGSLVVRREMLFSELKAGPAHVAWAAAGAAFRATEGCLARGPQTTGYDAAFVAVIIGA
jgi:hypothetical protein